MMPYNYPLIMSQRKQTAAEQTFFSTIKNLKFPSNKFRVWRSSFFRFPTSGELCSILIKRGERLSQKTHDAHSLLKAAECFSQAALLEDRGSEIVRYLKEHAQTLEEMAVGHGARAKK